MHSEICPVCGGTGIYKEYQNYSSWTYMAKTCHGCSGRGWITVPYSKSLYSNFNGGCRK